MRKFIENKIHHVKGMGKFVGINIFKTENLGHRLMTEHITKNQN